MQLQERLARIERELQAEDEKRDLEARHKAQQIENAELRRHATVNDSQMVDEMFGFIEAQVDMASEAGAPTAFQVCCYRLVLLILPDVDDVSYYFWCSVEFSEHGNIMLIKMTCIVPWLTNVQWHIL